MKYIILENLPDPCHQWSNYGGGAGNYGQEMGECLFTPGFTVGYSYLSPSGT